MKFSRHNDHFCCFQSQMMTGLQVLLLFLLSVGVQQQSAMLPCCLQRLHGHAEISLSGWKRGPSVTIALYLKAHPPRVVGFLFPEFVAFSLAWGLVLVRESHAFSIRDAYHTGPNSKFKSMWVSLDMWISRAIKSISFLICPGFPAGTSAAHLASLFPVSPSAEQRSFSAHHSSKHPRLGGLFSTKNVIKVSIGFEVGRKLIG